jgi:Cys-tRNA(Pro)/Cys-tRNA(Cys) deacylase
MNMAVDDVRGEGSVRTPLDVLGDSGVDYTVRQHVPIIGRDDAEQKLGLPTEKLLKTMVFRAGETVVLAALPVHGKVNYGKLAQAIGVPRSALRQADADDLRSVGMVPGGASPVCGVDSVVTVFDSSVPDMGLVYCGSGHADRTIEIEAEALVELTRPIIAELIAR